VVAARVLGAADFGAYSTAAAFAVLLSIVATLGMTPLLVREIAQAPGRAPALLAAAHAVKTASNVLMLALLFVLARYVLAYPTPVVAASLLLGISYAVGAYVENLAAWFQAVERMHVWTQASAAFGLVTGGLGLLLVLWTRSLAWFCAAPIAGQLAALAWLLARLPAEARRGGRVEAVEALRLVRALAPFAAAFVPLTVHYKVDGLLRARWPGCSHGCRRRQDAAGASRRWRRCDWCARSRRSPPRSSRSRSTTRWTCCCSRAGAMRRRSGSTRRRTSSWTWRMRWRSSRRARSTRGSRARRWLPRRRAAVRAAMRAPAGGVVRRHRCRARRRGSASGRCPPPTP